MRNRIIVALALALATFASGCDRKAEGQTVAVVNDEEVTATELNAELSAANLPRNLRSDEARSRILQTMIDRRLLAQQARTEGLDTSPEFLNRQRRMTEDLLISMLASRQLNTEQLPSAPEISRYQASRPGMFAKREFWNLDQLQYEAPTNPAVKSQIVAAKTLAQLAGVLTKNNIAFTRSRNRVDTAVIPPDMYGRIATLPKDEPFVIPAGGKMVASVIVAREPSPLVGDQARPLAVAAMRRDQGTKFMQDRLKSLRKSAKIEYKEGFAPPKR